MGATAQTISAPTAIAMPLMMRLFVSANVEANWHGEFERFTGHVRRRWREGLRAPHGVDRFLIESRRSRGPYDAARNDLAVAIEREGEFCRTGLVPRAGGGRIALVALDLLGNSAMP